MIRPAHANQSLSRPRRASAQAQSSAAWPDLRSPLAAIVEHSNDAIFSRRFDGIITTWNTAAERIFGYRADEVIGRSSRLMLSRGQRDELRSLLARMRRGEVVKHFETERRCKNGRRIHVSLTLSPVRDARGRLIGFSTIARDITDERRMRDLLTRREHELQDLFDAASVGIVLLARDGTILRANHAFIGLMEAAPREVIGHKLGEFHSDPSGLQRMLAQLAARQKFSNISTELLTQDGEARHVLVDASALWEEGRFVHSRWFVRDISQRKRLERELLEMSERDRRGFAHELHDGLGQQLGGVAYLSNVLREKLTERAAPEAPDAARIFGLVRDAIEQTRRLSRGLSPIQPEPDGLMNALRDLAAQTTELFHLRCRFTCRKPVLIEDSSLAGHLYRIAQEAVNNALKHAKPARIHLRLRREGNCVSLMVADDGRGIGKISPRRQGLGLHIMQYRASLVRGTLNIQARRGGGTEVLCLAPSPSRKSGRKRP